MINSVPSCPITLCHTCLNCNLEYVHMHNFGLLLPRMMFKILPPIPVPFIELKYFCLIILIKLDDHFLQEKWGTNNRNLQSCGILIFRWTDWISINMSLTLHIYMFHSLLLLSYFGMMIMCVYFRVIIVRSKMQCEHIIGYRCYFTYLLRQPVGWMTRG